MSANKLEDDNSSGASSSQNDAIGKSAQQVDAEQPGDAELAEHLGVSLADDQDDSDDLPSKSEMWAVIKSQQDTIERLSERVSDLEDRADTADESRKGIAKQANDAKADAKDAKETATHAVKKVSQLDGRLNNMEREADADADAEPETAHDLPGSPKRSRSPLDFWANLRLKRMKDYWQSQNKQNTGRAVHVARLWEEYAHRRNDGRGIFWTKDDVETALVEVMGEKPHRQTLRRVWEKLADLGGEDTEKNRRCISNQQEPTPIIEMPREAAEALTEGRYIGLDLLDDSDAAGHGAVTPVVTGPEAAGV